MASASTHPSFAHLEILEAGSHATANPMVIVHNLGFLQVADPTFAEFLAGIFCGISMCSSTTYTACFASTTKGHAAGEAKGKHIALVTPPHPDAEIVSTEPLIIPVYLSGVATGLCYFSSIPV